MVDILPLVIEKVCAREGAHMLDRALVRLREPMLRRTAAHGGGTHGARGGSGGGNASMVLGDRGGACAYGWGRRGVHRGAGGGEVCVETVRIEKTFDESTRPCAVALLVAAAAAAVSTRDAAAAARDAADAAAADAAAADAGGGGRRTAAGNVASTAARTASTTRTTVGAASARKERCSERSSGRKGQRWRCCERQRPEGAAAGKVRGRAHPIGGAARTVKRRARPRENGPRQCWQRQTKEVQPHAPRPHGIPRRPSGAIDEATWEARPRGSCKACRCEAGASRAPRASRDARRSLQLGGRAARGLATARSRRRRRRRRRPRHRRAAGRGRTRRRRRATGPRQLLGLSPTRTSRTAAQLAR